MLTGHNTDSDTILGLESGANDYVAKPAVLLARIRTQPAACHAFWLLPLDLGKREVQLRTLSPGVVSWQTFRKAACLSTMQNHNGRGGEDRAARK